MSFLLCCLLGKNTEKDNINIEKNVVYKRTNNLKNLREEIDNTQPNNLDNYSIYSPRIIFKYSKAEDTLIDIGGFEKCQYWFTLILKCLVDYDSYGKNKKELFDHVWKFINLNKTLQYYKLYNEQYHNFNEENIKSFCKDINNQDFLTDIRISENIYRMSY